MKELEVGDLVRDKYGDIGTVVGVNDERTEVDIYDYDMDEGWCEKYDEVVCIGVNKKFLAGEYDDYECRP